MRDLAKHLVPAEAVATATVRHHYIEATTAIAHLDRERQLERLLEEVARRRVIAGVLRLHLRQFVRIGQRIVARIVLQKQNRVPRLDAIGSQNLDDVEVARGDASIEVVPPDLRARLQRAQPGIARKRGVIGHFLLQVTAGGMPGSQVVDGPEKEKTRQRKR